MFSLKDLCMLVLMYLEKGKAEFQATQQPWSTAMEEMVCTLSRGRGMIRDCNRVRRLSLLNVGIRRNALFHDFFSDVQWCASQILNSQSPELLQKKRYAQTEGRSLLDLLLDLLLESYASASILKPADPQQNKRLPGLVTEITGSNYGNAHKGFPPALDLDGFPQEKLLLQDTLGVGAQGVVRRGKWLGDSFAVKIIPISCFETEMEVLTKMRHPNVVEMKGYIRRSDLRPEEDEYDDLMIVEGEYCGLVMELMAKSLETLIEEENGKKANKVPFSLLLSIDILLQIARGMRFLQECGVMHRDLKPGNVLVNHIHDIPSGAGKKGYLIVKLSDFGLSKPCKSKEGSAEGLTYKAGTPFYVAPEARQDSKVVFTKEADVFSFGTTCFNVVSGRFFSPDDNGGSDGFYKRIERGDVQEYLSGCESPDLAALIKQCWSPAAAARPTFSEACVKLETMKRNMLLGHPLDYRIALKNAPTAPSWKAVEKALAEHLNYFERVLECLFIAWNMICEDGFGRWVKGEAAVNLELCAQDLAEKIALLAKSTDWYAALKSHSAARLVVWVMLMDLCVELWCEVLRDPFLDRWELSDAVKGRSLPLGFANVRLDCIMDLLIRRSDQDVWNLGRSLLSEIKVKIKEENADLALLLSTAVGEEVGTPIPSTRWIEGFSDALVRSLKPGHVRLDPEFYRLRESAVLELKAGHVGLDPTFFLLRESCVLEISVALLCSKFAILYDNRWGRSKRRVSWFASVGLLAWVSGEGILERVSANKEESEERERPREKIERKEIMSKRKYFMGLDSTKKCFMSNGLDSTEPLLMKLYIRGMEETT